MTSTGGQGSSRSASGPDLDLSVVVPIYNEAESLSPLHAELTDVLSSLGLRYEILAVDDGSQDDSVAVLRRLQEEDPFLKSYR